MQLPELDDLGGSGTEEAVSVTATLKFTTFILYRLYRASRSIRAFATQDKQQQACLDQLCLLTEWAEGFKAGTYATRLVLSLRIRCGSIENLRHAGASCPFASPACLRVKSRLGTVRIFTLRCGAELLISTLLDPDHELLVLCMPVNIWWVCRASLGKNVLRNWQASK